MSRGTFGPHQGLETIERGAPFAWAKGAYPRDGTSVPVITWNTANVWFRTLGNANGANAKHSWKMDIRQPKGSSHAGPQWIPCVDRVMAAPARAGSSPEPFPGVLGHVRPALGPDRSGPCPAHPGLQRPQAGRGRAMRGEGGPPEAISRGPATHHGETPKYFRNFGATYLMSYTHAHPVDLMFGETGQHTTCFRLVTCPYSQPGCNLKRGLLWC